MWIYDRIFIKPPPKYLLSRQFWTGSLLEDPSPLGGKRQKISGSALGLLRSYHYLMRHESDFAITCREGTRLLHEGITWTQFCKFSAPLEEISDSQVSARHTYGGLRLTRLNFYVKIFLRKFQYEQIGSQCGAYFSRFYGPLLFVFAIWSLLLNGMQVELGTESLASSQWRSFFYACRTFRVFTLLIIAFLMLSLVLLLVGMIADEWIYAVRCVRERRSQKNAPKQQV